MAKRPEAWLVGAGKPRQKDLDLLVGLSIEWGGKWRAVAIGIKTLTLLGILILMYWGFFA